MTIPTKFLSLSLLFLCFPLLPSLSRPLSLYPSLAMDWFSGGVPGAIAASRTHKALFIVYVYGTESNSLEFRNPVICHGFPWFPVTPLGCLCLCLHPRVNPCFNVCDPRVWYDCSSFSFIFDPFFFLFGPCLCL